MCLAWRKVHGTARSGVTRCKQTTETEELMVERDTALRAQCAGLATHTHSSVSHRIAPYIRIYTINISGWTIAGQLIWAQMPVMQYKWENPSEGILRHRVRSINKNCICTLVNGKAYEFVLYAHKKKTSRVQWTNKNATSVNYRNGSFYNNFLLSRSLSPSRLALPWRWDIT